MQHSHPSIEVVHFFSDGLTAQYRQKLNFFLFSTKIFQLGYLSATWNFWEASHGKGVPEGIGGSIKRQADKLISQGNDITDAWSLYQAMVPNTSIKLFFVEASEVEEAVSPQNLPTVPGTMKLHQLKTVREGVISYTDVSCFCSVNCSCFHAKNFSFPLNVESNTAAQTESNTASETAKSTTANQTTEFNPTCQAAETNSNELLVGAAETCGRRLISIENVDNLLNNWCVVKYEERIYPGIVTNIEETYIEVKCMSSAGTNRYYWPARDDVCWYSPENVLFCIPEPQRVGSRHRQIDPELWDEMWNRLNT